MPKSTFYRGGKSFANREAQIWTLPFEEDGEDDEMVYIEAPHDNRIRVRRNALEQMEGLIFWMFTLFLFWCCCTT